MRLPARERNDLRLMNLRFMMICAAVCCMAAAPAGLFAQMNLTDSLRHDGLTRVYALHLPPGYPESADWPLVVFLHGGGGNALSAQGFTRFNPVADEGGFLVAYPQGYTAIDSASYVWADGRNTAADRAGVDDAGFISALLDTLEEEYAVDPERIYVCGFSNGGFMTQRLACESNDRFAAMAGLGSIIDTARIQTCAPGRAVPMLLLAGTDDPFVPFEGGAMTGGDPRVLPVVSVAELVAFWVDRNGCAPAPEEARLPDLVEDDGSTARVFEYGGCDCGAALAYYQVDGGGHTWPGVELPAYELIAGETNEDFLASEALWAFFRRFRRACPYDETTSRAEARTARPLRLTPNPARERTFVHTAAPVEFVRVYDLRGRRLRQFAGPELDLAGLAPGVYVVRIRTRGAFAAARLAVY